MDNQSAWRMGDSKMKIERDVSSVRQMDMVRESVLSMTDRILEKVTGEKVVEEEYVDVELDDPFKEVRAGDIKPGMYIKFYKFDVALLNTNDPNLKVEGEPYLLQVVHTTNVKGNVRAWFDHSMMTKKGGETGKMVEFKRITRDFPEDQIVKVVIPSWIEV